MSVGDSKKTYILGGHREKRIWYTTYTMTQDEALAILKTGANVFLTGEPGSGKTHTINAYTRYLRSRNINPAITASTGIAATHIEGMTIHAWSGVGIRTSITPYDIDQLLSKENLVKRIKNTSVLIIDEISMLDSTLLDMVDTVCRAIRGREEAFGGMQVVFVGDFFQLPPISSREGGASFAFRARSWMSANPIVCYLSEQYRQDDHSFLSLLNAIRTNTVSAIEHDMLSNRIIQNASEYTLDVPKLFAHNIDVDRMNSEALQKLSGERKIYTMKHTGSRPLAEALARGCLSPGVLELTVGARVMCTKNDPAGLFVNGTLGVVISFSRTDGFPIIETFSGKRIKVTRTEWVLEENGKKKASITQIPLRLAWAITVHKSQGMSLDSAVVDLSRAFEYGQGYVALSRVRRLSGLYLSGYNKRSLEVHPEILAQDEQFKKESIANAQRFQHMNKKQLRALHSQFIRAIGGVEQNEKNLERKKAENTSISTITETHILLKKKFSVKEIARKRGLKETTVWEHIETLHQKNVLVQDEVFHLGKSLSPTALSEIHTAFDTHGTKKLRPVFEALGGRYDWDTLRLARILYT